MLAGIPAYGYTSLSILFKTVDLSTLHFTLYVAFTMKGKMGT